jgi:hypothetical protein
MEQKLYTVKDLARESDFTRQWIHALLKYDDAPKPAVTIGNMKYYDEDALEVFKEYKRQQMAKRKNYANQPVSV